MSISCDCSYDGYEYPDFYRESFPTAKKEHICCECRQPIKKGQKYQRVTGKWDTLIDTFKTCIPCYNIRQHYCPHGYLFEGLKETISECLGFDYTDPDTEEDDEE